MVTERGQFLKHLTLRAFASHPSQLLTGEWKPFVDFDLWVLAKPLTTFLKKLSRHSQTLRALVSPFASGLRNWAQVCRVSLTWTCLPWCCDRSRVNLRNYCTCQWKLVKGPGPLQILTCKYSQTCWKKLRKYLQTLCKLILTCERLHISSFTSGLGNWPLDPPLFHSRKDLARVAWCTACLRFIPVDHTSVTRPYFVRLSCCINSRGLARTLPAALAALKCFFKWPFTAFQFHFVFLSVCHRPNPDG